ncbi:hypothetical protein V8G54_026588 [Vigna mungo]|uniref:Uncharacterized protein n=1 Tax=Vigna mungo TaxID=3915 RepID=A0AAQ3RMA7_VIGMU
MVLSNTLNDSTKSRFCFTLHYHSISILSGIKDNTQTKPNHTSPFSSIFITQRHPFITCNSNTINTTHLHFHPISNIFHIQHMGSSILPFNSPISILNPLLFRSYLKYSNSTE